MITLDTVVTRRADLVTEEFDDALLIWDGMARRLHHLDLIATVTWDELDGRRSLGEICEDLATVFLGQETSVRGDVLALAHRLVEEGLLERT